jgi:hypothetical protein
MTTLDYSRLLTLPSIDAARATGLSVDKVKRFRRQKMGPLTGNQTKLRQRMGALVAAKAKRQRTADRIDAARRELADTGRAVTVSAVAKHLHMTRGAVRAYWNEDEPRALTPRVHTMICEIWATAAPMGWSASRIWAGLARTLSDEDEIVEVNAFEVVFNQKRTGYLVRFIR